MCLNTEPRPQAVVDFQPSPTVTANQWDTREDYYRATTRTGDDLDRQSSLPVYRYPAPFAVPNQGWPLTLENERPVVSVRLGERRVGLRLKGSPRFHRQLGALRAIESGTAVQGELDLYQRGDDVLCKMVAWLPRDPGPKERVGTLFVRTTADAMIVALDRKGEKLWNYHGEQIPRWSAEHRKQLQRWADDSKAEH